VNPFSAPRSKVESPRQPALPRALALLFPPASFAAASFPAYPSVPSCDRLRDHVRDDRRDDPRDYARDFRQSDFPSAEVQLHGE